MRNPVLLAKIGTPHGVRGEVRVTSYTEQPLALGDYGPLFSKDGRKFSVAKARPAKNVLMVTFKEIQTRDDARNARGLELFVERDCLPDDIDDNEFYIGDLIGMSVVNTDNEIIGRVQAIPNFGAGDLLEISPRLDGGQLSSNTWFLAFTSQNVPDIDFEKDRVTIILPRQISERDDD